MTIAIVALAVSATPAVATKQDNALRRAPRLAPVAPASAPAPPAAPAVKPAVWIPAPVAGIKWSGGSKRAVWIR
jgi:hypothetical protein